MTYVVAAYALTLAVLGLYAASIWLRQRELRRSAGEDGR